MGRCYNNCPLTGIVFRSTLHNTAHGVPEKSVLTVRALMVYLRKLIVGENLHIQHIGIEVRLAVASEKEESDVEKPIFRLPSLLAAL